MSGFSDDFVPNGESNGAVADGTAAEFLAREQPELAGIEDLPVLAEVTPASDAAPVGTIPEPEVDDFMADGGVANLYAGGLQHTPELVMTPVPRVEPEAIRVWQEEHQTRLVEKDANEELAK